MGLTVSHNCWDASYSTFMAWRTALAAAAGLPPLRLMAGFYRPEEIQPSDFNRQGFNDNHRAEIVRALPIQWDCLKPSPLHRLLNHSDCGGIIRSKDCKPIAESLKKLIPKMGDWEPQTRQFMEGLMSAHAARQNVVFR